MVGSAFESTEATLSLTRPATQPVNSHGRVTPSYHTDPHPLTATTDSTTQSGSDSAATQPDPSPVMARVARSKEKEGWTARRGGQGEEGSDHSISSQCRPHLTLLSTTHSHTPIHPFTRLTTLSTLLSLLHLTPHLSRRPSTLPFLSHLTPPSTSLPLLSHISPLPTFPTLPCPQPSITLVVV